MFQNLAALVAKTPLSLTLTMEGDAMTVIVIPKGDDKSDQALSTPLALTGSPAELDAEFASLISSYTQSRQSLAEQLEAAQTVMQAAAKSATTKAAKANQKTANKPAPGTTAQSGEDDGDEDDDDSASTAAPAASAKPVGKPVETDPLSDLF